MSYLDYLLIRMRLMDSILMDKIPSLILKLDLHKFDAANANHHDKYLRESGKHRNFFQNLI